MFKKSNFYVKQMSPQTMPWCFSLPFGNAILSTEFNKGGNQKGDEEKNARLPRSSNRIAWSRFRGIPSY